MKSGGRCQEQPLARKTERERGRMQVRADWTVDIGYNYHYLLFIPFLRISIETQRRIHD